MDNNNDYPNLMCFGRDVHNCNCQKSCEDYEKCYKGYYQRYFAFMESDDSEE